MKPEEVYLAWAPPDSIWSPWAIPVPFAQIVCVPVESERELAGIDSLAHGVAPESDLAVVLDLSGDHGVRFSLALALRGFRPVPLIDGSPGPDVLGISQAILAEQPAVPTRAFVAVDMRQTLRWLCIGAALAIDENHGEREPRVYPRLPENRARRCVQCGGIRQ